jgi:hypothetical protein
VVAALTGCSTATAAVKPKPTHVPTAVGEDAALIAKRIEGCTNVQAGDIASGAPSLLSTATCTIDGHTVNINSWASASDANLDLLLIKDNRDTYYASGDAWTVTLGDDPMLQYQLTNQGGKLFADAINGHTTWPTDPSAEEDISKAAVASLGGAVQHASP